MKHRTVVSVSALAIVASLQSVQPSVAWPQVPDLSAADRDSIVLVAARGMGGMGGRWNGWHGPVEWAAWALAAWALAAWALAAWALAAWALAAWALAAWALAAWALAAWALAAWAPAAWAPAAWAPAVWAVLPPSEAAAVCTSTAPPFGAGPVRRITAPSSVA